MSSHNKKTGSLSVGVAELKARLSHYLRQVEQGKRVQVCDRHRAIAELVMAEKADDALELEVRRGEIRRASLAWSDLEFTRLPEKVDAQGALSWVRGD